MTIQLGWPLLCAAASSPRMIRGLYRTQDRLLGCSARVHWSAGDAAPIVSKVVYMELGGVPEWSLLPSRDDYANHTFALEPDPLELG